MRTNVPVLLGNSRRQSATGAVGWLTRRPLTVALIVLGCAYVAYPYVTLYRLGTALQRGDVQYVMSSLDWNSVRAGIAEDVASTMTGVPIVPAGNAAPQDDLPAFGSSFASNVATNAVDQYLTPDAFAASLSPAPAAGDTKGGDAEAAHLHWAFFSAPTSFVADLTAQDGATIKLRMDLIGTSWVLTRAWLPPEMLAAHHT